MRVNINWTTSSPDLYIISVIEKKIRIPFHLCDPAQIMFFGAFNEIYHMFLENNLPEMGIPWESWFKGETGCPVRALATDYQRPLQFGKDYVAKLSVEKLTESTATFHFSIGTPDQAHAINKVTHCFVDKKERKKTSIPKQIRESLQEHLLSNPS